jgi:hypothetical protein
MMFGEISQGEFNHIVGSSDEASTQRLSMDQALTKAIASDAFIQGLISADPTSSESQVALIADVVSSASSNFHLAKSAGAVSAFVNIRTMWSIQNVQTSFWSNPAQFNQLFSDERFLLINSHYGRR